MRTASRFTTDELYNKYCDIYTTTYAVDASEVPEEDDDDDDDDQEAGRTGLPLKLRMSVFRLPPDNHCRVLARGSARVFQRGNSSGVRVCSA